MSVRVGVIGLGSVFGPYSVTLSELEREGRAQVLHVYDLDDRRTAAAVDRFPAARAADSADDLLGRPDLDVVVILTDMTQHGSLAFAALEAGKHVLVEKPMATTLDQAAELIEESRVRDRLLVCAPHVLLSPTFQQMHRRIRAGVIGEVKLARGLYGWPGPTWSKWFYQRGGGALFDLGVYNVTTLCGLLGPVRRVTALMGVAVPQRRVGDELVSVEAADNAQLLLDFGDQCYASITTGFTIQRYGRGPALELYGLDGTMNMLGDDWAPTGFEQWRNEAHQWELIPESAPNWQWTSGITELVDCVETGRPTITRPEHAFHVLEVMLAAERSAATGSAVAVTSDFPEPDFDCAATHLASDRASHDSRML